MTYYQQQYVKAKINLQYAVEGYKNTVKRLADLLSDQHSVKDIPGIIEELNTAGEVVQEAMDDVDRAEEYLKEKEGV